MRGITPCLWFDTEAEEAAAFYTGIFPDGRVLGTTRYGPVGPGREGTVMTVEWEVLGRRFMGLNGGPRFTFTEAVSFQVHCETQEEVDRLWEALSDGGREGPCGWVTDRYGLSWQVVPTRLTELVSDPDPATRDRAMAAMLRMGKIDMAALEAAVA
jgi:predicted 3-demethylubiquinone-9 3-methyltransferase (glyoxalase superfamily)